VLALAAIPLLAALHLVGGKVKGEGMKTKTAGGKPPKGPKGPFTARKGQKSRTKTTATTKWYHPRNMIGQSLIVMAGMGASMVVKGTTCSALFGGSRSRIAALQRF
jgi:hypothetical protein